MMIGVKIIDGIADYKEEDKGMSLGREESLHAYATLF